MVAGWNMDRALDFIQLGAKELMTKLKQHNKVLRKFISLPIFRIAIACLEAVFASTLYQIKCKWAERKIALNLVRFLHSLCFVIVIKILSVKKCYNYTQKLLMKETWEQWGEKREAVRKKQFANIKLWHSIRIGNNLKN